MTDPCPVALELEVAKAIRKSAAISGPAIRFNKNGTPFPLIGGVYNSRAEALIALEATEATVFQRILDGLARRVPRAPWLLKPVGRPKLLMCRSSVGECRQAYATTLLRNVKCFLEDGLFVHRYRAHRLSRSIATLGRCNHCIRAEGESDASLSLLGARHSVALMGCVIHEDAPRSGALPAHELRYSGSPAITR
jgi:hypothetical protein